MWLTSLEISTAEAHILLESCSDKGVLMFLCPLTEAPFGQSLCQLDRESLVRFFCKSVLRPPRFLSNLPRAVRRGGAVENRKGGFTKQQGFSPTCSFCTERGPNSARLSTICLKDFSVKRLTGILAPRANITRSQSQRQGVLLIKGSRTSMFSFT